MSQVAFTVNYQVGQPRKLELFITRFCQSIGHKAIDLSIEKYPKFEGQYQARFAIAIGLVKPEEVVYQMLLWAQLLSGSTQGQWSVNGPWVDEFLSFDCTFNGGRQDQPLKWANLTFDGLE